MKRKKITAADLFCGAGGTSTGLQLACKALGYDLNLVAVNHWQIAIATHSKNHPEAEHFCTNLDNVDPRKLVPSGKLDLLVASPECTHHSNARGGKPVNDQSRASGWRVVEWASQIRIETILIENVKEFRSWGPIGTNGKPLKKRKGELYFAFLNALRALGYIVEERILNAADYGAPTSRERLFIQARLGRKAIGWPERTHAPKDKVQQALPLFKTSSTLKPYRPAREIIDWTIPSRSIFNRKKPLKPNTLARIYAGLQKFSGIPFIVPKEGDDRIRSIDRPLQTITTQSRGIGLVQPFLVKFYGGHDAQSLDKPLPAVTANYEHFGLAQPFIVVLRNNMGAASIDNPLSTIATSGAHHGLCQPFITRFQGNHDGRSDGNQRNHSLEEPLPTLDTSNRYGLVSPFLVQTMHGQDDYPGRRVHSLDQPIKTITAGDDGWAIAEPFLVKYNGTAKAASIDEPIDTLSTKDRFGLVEPRLEGSPIAVLDIHFRMLQPHELAAAQGFPKSYVFVGNREDQVKQIGNAVSVEMAEALLKTILK
ncbi:MAG: DNA cytosine methyltransferase [Blastocatellia bacterium]